MGCLSINIPGITFVLFISIIHQNFTFLLSDRDRTSEKNLTFVLLKKPDINKKQKQQHPLLNSKKGVVGIGCLSSTGYLEGNGHCILLV